MDSETQLFLVNMRIINEGGALNKIIPLLSCVHTYALNRFVKALNWFERLNPNLLFTLQAFQTTFELDYSIHILIRFDSIYFLFLVEKRAR